MRDINAICDRLVAAARSYGIDSLTCLDYVPDAPTPPVLYVADITTAYTGGAVTFDGAGALEVTVTVLSGGGDDQSAQRLLRDYMASSGPTSVRAALESARGGPGECALGGACDDYHVRGIRNHRLYTTGDGRFYGAQWVIQVIGDGDE